MAKQLPPSLQWLLKDINPMLSKFWVWTEFGEKKLWSYLNLLIVPLFLAFGTFYLSDQSSRSQKQADEARAAQENLAAQLQAEKEQDLADQRYRQNTLESYLDDMTSLIEKGLLETQNQQLKTIARARTITTLKILDAESNRVVVEFLRNAGLVKAFDPESLPAIELTHSDLKGADLEGIILSHLSLSNSLFQGANLSQAYLTDSFMREANFNGANLSGAILIVADLTDAQLENANLSGANLRGANLQYSNLRSANLVKAQLQGVGDRDPAGYFNGEPLEPADLTGANLTDADLRGANLNGVDLRQAMLTDTNFQGADLEGVSFSEPTSSVFCRTIMPDGTVENPNCEK